MNRYEGLNKEMLKRVAPLAGRRELLPALSNRAQLALTCRMLFREGWDDHIAGHLTWRQEDGSILSNPWELAWDELTASEIIRLDKHGRVIEGEWNITPAIGLHVQLHALRPDVHVVAHNHGRWSGIWANMHRTPPVYDQTGAMVSGDLPLYNEYEGTFDHDDASRAAAEALGDAKWALLANHGALVVGRNLRQAHLRVLTLEWRSRRAWEVETAGGGKPMPEAEAARLGLPDENGFPFLWEAMARRELREHPEILDE